MKQWSRRIRGAVGMGLTWAIGWALAGVFLVATATLVPSLPWSGFFEVFDAPAPAMAVPGFVGGALFSIVLGIAARHRRFDELSLPRFAAWGALGGLLLTLLPTVLVGVGLATPEHPGAALWPTLVTIGGPFVLLSAASAAGSLLLARRVERRGLQEGQETWRVDARSS